MWKTCQGKETPQRVNEVFSTKFNDGVIPVPPTPPRSTHPPPSPPLHSTGQLALPYKGCQTDETPQISMCSPPESKKTLQIPSFAELQKPTTMGTTTTTPPTTTTTATAIDITTSTTMDDEVQLAKACSTYPDEVQMCCKHCHAVERTRLHRPAG